MCGIAGIVARHPINKLALTSMVKHLVHRGPDGEGFWFSDDDKVGLGHQRLAIIDPTAAGAQPMRDPSNSAVITYNGEIYNFVEIGERLKAEGIQLNSRCDTEVLLAAYLTWGTDCLRELNGMFAFAIFDSRTNELFCARDRFGEKPFLFHRTDNYFVFSSEYKALLSIRDIDASINETRLLKFLATSRLGLDDDNETIFPAIKQLRPGEKATLNINTMELKISRYWDVKPDPFGKTFSDAEAVDRFRDLLMDSVKIRMRSDVPVGSCLSGGLDSSSIVSLSNEMLELDTDYHVFTGRFTNTNSDEWQYASQVINHTGVISHVIEPAGDTFVDELDDFIWFNELPVGSSSQYAQWCVFRLAKDIRITVLLDGQGADELLAGYEQYFSAYLASLPEPERVSEANAIRKRYPFALDSNGNKFKSAIPDFLRHIIASISKRGSNPTFGFTRNAVKQLGQFNNPIKFMGDHQLASALHEDSFVAHLPTLLRYGDRNSMAHSREVRLPFCDHRIAELSLSLAPKILMGGTQTKRLLRQSMKGILPEIIRTRWNKQGFLPPQHLWFRGKTGDLLRDTINSHKFKERGYWNARWWQGCLKRFDNGEQHLAWSLWRPLITEAWYRYFMQRINDMPRFSVQS